MGGGRSAKECSAHDVTGYINGYQTVHAFVNSLSSGGIIMGPVEPLKPIRWKNTRFHNQNEYMYLAHILVVLSRHYRGNLHDTVHSLSSCPVPSVS